MTLKGITLRNPGMLTPVTSTCGVEFMGLVFRVQDLGFTEFYGRGLGFRGCGFGAEGLGLGVVGLSGRHWLCIQDGRTYTPLLPPLD